MSELTIFNTLTRKKEKFIPIQEGKVGMYSCGPTVYWYQHIGNLRTYIFSDTLKRTLQFNGYKVNHIINVTDVGHLTSDADEGEDKMEKAAAKEGKTAKEIAEHYFQVFREDFKKLNIEEPSKWTKATEHIKEQIELIKKLEKNTYTYKTSDGIYFNSLKFKNYGELAKLNIEGLESGKRVSAGEKQSKTDFALWKFSEIPGKRQQEWESPWGVGFPGWHIECSAMSMKYLGEHFDIHTGGEDHIPIHHTNEIAQSESATGEKFVNYWMHGSFLLSKGEKVSKSKGGLFTISELEELGYKPLHYRYLCLQTHYRKQMNFSLEALDAAKNAYEKLRRRVAELRSSTDEGKDKTQEYKKEFIDSINDDLNMPLALQVLWKALEDSEFDPQKKIAFFEEMDKVLALGISEMKEEKSEIPEEIIELAKKREQFRKEKKWKEADQARDEILEKGYTLEDTPTGPRIEKAN